MEKVLNKLDIDKNIGEIPLTNGGTLEVPRISMYKIIKIVKFLGIDAIKVYNDAQEILFDENLDDFTRIALVLESIKEEQLIRIFSILLDLEDKQALNLDPNEMLDVILLYVEKTNITKTFSQVRQIYKKIFKRDLPDISEWINQRVQQANEESQAIEDSQNGKQS
ncbi:hypothetical protein F7731_23525 [Cytobacillus depressus]|uniref:Uncharacterized protein n=1 Tax=Cytobacillus depressus TaxID=1602942 RepID=A0A6L3V0E3_9BACI|nr:hypothetical protein [Cytobacillus depressus]KAB2328927.1 hypothetical protein F7731_23525 [Cytobacillus depressus]